MMKSQSFVCLRSVSGLSHDFKALLTYFVIQSEPKILRLVFLPLWRHYIYFNIDQCLVEYHGQESSNGEESCLCHDET